MKTASKDEQINLVSEKEGAYSGYTKFTVREYLTPSPTFARTDTGTFVATRESQTDVYFGEKTQERPVKTVGTDEIIFDELDSPIPPRGRLAITYTDSFLKLKIAKFVLSLQSLLKDWSESLGDPSELQSVKKMFNLIEENSRYFEVKPNSRLVLGTIQNFFLKWGKLEKKQISRFGELIEWFTEGDIPESKVRTFNQEVFLLVQRNKSENAKEE